MNDKKCTWVDCPETAKHQEPGSFMALCDYHNEKMNNDVKSLFKFKESPIKK